MSDFNLFQGYLKKSDPCWFIIDDTSEVKYFLVGDLEKVRDGDYVFVFGQTTTTHACGSGNTLLVFWIGTKMEGSDALPSIVKRNVNVKITRSSNDSSPRFRLEGNLLKLSAESKIWVGNFENVTVEGELDIYFESSAWANQSFDFSVIVTDPEDSSKEWKEHWNKDEYKGYVSFDETLNVGSKS